MVLRPVGDAVLIPAPRLHPHLLTPLAFTDDASGAAQAVWEFQPGVTLREIVDAYKDQSQLPPLGLVVRAVLDAARVMQSAHEYTDGLGNLTHGVHGGIADRSLLMGFDGHTRVLDFGVRASGRFTAPEIMSGGPYDPRADVFSLAAVLHAGLTGFDGAYAAVLAGGDTADFPPPSTVHPDATAELDALVMRALAVDPAARLGSTAELADGLENIVGAAVPRHEACGARLRQMFEGRLAQLHALLPPVPNDAGLGPRLPAPRVMARPSAPRLAPTKRAEPAVAEAPVSEGEKTLNTVDLSAPVDAERTVVQTVPPAALARARPTGARQRMTGAHDQVPWDDRSPAAPVDVTDEPTRIGMRAAAPEADAADVKSVDDPDGAAVADAGDVPTSPPMRALGPGQRKTGERGMIVGQSEEERSRALGQELVQTGEFEAPPPEELTQVRPIPGLKEKAPSPAAIPETNAPAAAAAGAAPASTTQELDPPARKPAAGPPMLTPRPASGSGAKVAVVVLALLAAFGFAIGRFRPDLVTQFRAKFSKPPVPVLQDAEGEPLGAVDDDAGAAPEVTAVDDADAGSTGN